MQFAFYGRVSTEDAQDPSLSLPRQLAACERIVQQAAGEIVACYWDIESGRKQLDKQLQDWNRLCNAIGLVLQGS